MHLARKVFLWLSLPFDFDLGHIMVHVELNEIAEFLRTHFLNLLPFLRWLGLAPLNVHNARWFLILVVSLVLCSPLYYLGFWFLLSFASIFFYFLENVRTDQVFGNRDFLSLGAWRSCVLSWSLNWVFFGNRLLFWRFFIFWRMLLLFLQFRLINYLLRLL